MECDNNHKDMHVVSWNGLPCLILRDKAIVFSYIDDTLVCSILPATQLDDEQKMDASKRLRFFDCLDYKGIRDVPVKQITLCLTERCNSRCRYCFLDANTTGTIMQVETMHSALDFAFAKYAGCVVVVSAFGGEPGTREDLIWEMVHYTESIKNKYNVTPEYAITTNGVISDSLIDFLIEHKFTCTISTDGIREVQDRQRPLANGKPSFDFVYHTLSRLSSSSGVYVKIRSTVTKYSVSFMEEAVEMYGKLGIRQIHFEPVTAAGRALNSDEVIPPSVEEYAQHIIRSIDIAAQYGSKINFSFCSRCTGALKNKLIIGANGLISSCVEVQNESHEFSQYFKTGRIADGKVTCADNPHIIPNQLNDYFKQAKCKDCPYKIFCMDTCPIRNFRATGHFHQTEPFKCKLYHLLLPEILYRFYTTTCLTLQNPKDNGNY